MPARRRRGGDRAGADGRGRGSGLPAGGGAGRPSPLDSAGLAAALPGGGGAGGGALHGLGAPARPEPGATGPGWLRRSPTPWERSGRPLERRRCAWALARLVVGVGPKRRDAAFQHELTLEKGVKSGQPLCPPPGPSARAAFIGGKMKYRDRATEVALFRYTLDPGTGRPGAEQSRAGRLVRALAGTGHTGPDGEEVRVGRSTVDEWIRAWRAGGFEALKPKPRALSPKVPAEVFALAEALRREAPERTAAHICQIIATAHGWAPNERTIQRHFRRVGHDPALAGQRGRLRPLRGVPAQRAVGGRRPARPGRRPPQGHPVRLLGRPFPAFHRLSVGDGRGHRARRGRPAGRPGFSGRARGGLLGQRQPVCVRPAAAGLRQLGHPARPLPAGPARRAGQDRAGLPHRAGTSSSSRPPMPASKMSPGSTSFSPPGSRPSITGRCTPRPT